MWDASIQSLQVLTRMKAFTMNHRLLIALAAVGFAAAPSIHAAAIISFSQNGSNVVATGSGSFNLLALTSSLQGFFSPVTRPVSADLTVGVSGFSDTYSKLSGPTGFGPGPLTYASSGSGDIFGVASGAFLAVPKGYVSGTALSGSATWTNTTIAGLGLNPGSYLYTWGISDVSDSLKVIVPGASSAVPEPQSLVLISGGVLAMLAMRKRIASRLH